MSTPWFSRLSGLTNFRPAETSRRQAQRRRSRPLFETLEAREVLSAVFYVSNTNDSGAGSLRQAIIDSDNSPIVQQAPPASTGLGGAAAAQAPFNLIEFELPVGSKISPKSALPSLTVPVEFYTPINFQNGSFQPSITLDGSSAGSGTVGLTVKTSGTRIQGLAIDNFSGGGVLYDGSAASGEVLYDNFIGVDLSGSGAAGNGTFGVEARNGASNIYIYSNVISANSGNGIVFTGAGTSGNQVFSNMIGTDATGTHYLGNGGSGVDFWAGASNNTVGTGNVISGNGYYGVYFSDPGTSGNVVQGNDIGTDVTGTHPLGNGVNGVEILGGASSNTIGGVTPGARNIISGNGGTGVVITQQGTNNNYVEGNYIGTDVTGSLALANGSYGVILSGGASQNYIGTTQAGAGNVISGDSINVFITDSGTSLNWVEGDLIGTNASDTAAVGGSCGILITGGASNTGVFSDVISGNAFGVEITGPGTTNNFVYFCEIGTNAAGTQAIPNYFYGVYVYGSSGNYVVYNTVADNGYYGIVAFNSDSNDYYGNNYYGNGYGGLVSF
jgi:titin